MKMIRLVISLAVGSLIQNAVAADNTPALGRLFMTPEWRTALERQRAYNIQESRSLEGGSIRLDGVVARSSGKTTVWVNNRPQDEKSGDTGVAATLSRHQPDRAILSTGNEAPADLRVGASLNRATRETTGGLAEGEIRVHRAKPQK
jgi:hypothetical protein